MATAADSVRLVADSEDRKVLREIIEWVGRVWGPRFGHEIVAPEGLDFRTLRFDGFFGADVQKGLNLAPVHSVYAEKKAVRDYRIIWSREPVQFSVEFDVWKSSAKARTEVKHERNHYVDTDFVACSLQGNPAFVESQQGEDWPQIKKSLDSIVDLICNQKRYPPVYITELHARPHDRLWVAVLRNMDEISCSVLREIAREGNVDVIAAHAVDCRLDIRIKPGHPVPWDRPSPVDDGTQTKRHKAV